MQLWCNHLPVVSTYELSDFDPGKGSLLTKSRSNSLDSLLGWWRWLLGCAVGWMLRHTTCFPTVVGNTIYNNFTNCFCSLAKTDAQQLLLPALRPLAAWELGDQTSKGSNN
jgi:hypothetical protein